MLTLKTQNAAKFLAAGALAAIKGEADKALETVTNGSGAGNDFLGWVDLPGRTDEALQQEIADAAKALRERCDTVVCIGIGGSYLGAKAVISALSNSLAEHMGGKVGAPEVLFAGQNIGEDYLYELQEYLKGRQFGSIVIS